jgi:hypothetical protein
VAPVAFILILDNVIGVVNGVVGQDTKGTGRIPLLKEVFGAFKKISVFGGGIYYDCVLYATRICRCTGSTAPSNRLWEA